MAPRISWAGVEASGGRGRAGQMTRVQKQQYDRLRSVNKMTRNRVAQYHGSNIRRLHGQR